MKSQRMRIAIVGAGFAGLNVAKALRKAAVDILLVDRNNFHTFTPLLYQVATCGLDPSDIAYPVRGILRGQSNLRFLLGTVTESTRTPRRSLCPHRTAPRSSRMTFSCWPPAP
ncbi:MAG: FAD-dependent oxidoreductase [Chloroflexi bacterium]|nr:FAD-dependent oxidoreductase [Chloroflexota bacterium]